MKMDRINCAIISTERTFSKFLVDFRRLKQRFYCMGKKKFTLFLINPKLKYKHYGAQQELCELMNKKAVTVPLALPLIAAYTPNHYDIRIINDELEQIPLDRQPDIVGITTLISTIDRAYEIADKYRELGAKVVLGGSYATFKPNEALEHADAVVRGEAEVVWPRLLKDFEEERLENIYEAGRKKDFSTSPVPRWDLVNTDELMTLSVETSRGCPFNCEFCLVNKMFGRKMRYREVDDVIEEIKSLPSKNIFFVDDNLTINKNRSRELIRKLKPLGLSWVCQCSLDIAEDKKLLEDMAEAGCIHILIGFESVNPDSLLETKKYHNDIAKYEEAIITIRSFGIHVIASFIVGFDADTIDSFEHINKFIEKNDILYPMISVLTAAPGTDLWNRMERERRLCGVDRELVNGTFPMMKSRHMEMTEVFDRYFSTLENVFSFENSGNRALRLYKKGFFRKPGPGTISFFKKVITTFSILKRFAFSHDKLKRRLFRDLFSLHRRKMVAPDRIIIFLLTMEAYSEYLLNVRPELSEIRSRIAECEKGFRTMPH